MMLSFDCCLIIEVWTLVVLANILTFHFDSDFFILAKYILMGLVGSLGTSSAHLRHAHKVLAVSLSLFTFSHLVCFIASVSLTKDCAWRFLLLLFLSVSWITSPPIVGLSIGLSFCFSLSSLVGGIIVYIMGLVLI